MDRSRVLCPSISLAAHAAFAATLLFASLLMPERLPLPPDGGFIGRVRLDASMLGRIAGPPAVGPLDPVRRLPPRVPPRPSQAAISSLAGFVPSPDTIDLTGAPGIEGLPPGLPMGNGTGVCLVDCGTDQGDGRTIAADNFLPRPVGTSALVRAGRGGILQEPHKLRHVAPEYPPLAIATRVQGRVVLDCVIDENGRMASVTVLSGNPLLEASAVEAVRQWRYTPTLLDGVRVSVLLTVSVDFRLR